MAHWTDYAKLRLEGVKKTKRKETLGKGSYGRVIEVSVNGTICAAKVIHEILVEEVGRKDFEATERLFLNECVNSSRMLHPNVVQFLGIYYPSPKDKLPWLIMEMMYTNLTSLIEKYKTTDLPLHIKLSILVDTSQGLQYLHSRDIIHRDLSSNNVLLTQQWVAKIADFGMAKIVSIDLSKYTRAPGTQPFMSLEALSVQPRYSKPLDVFSLGCVSLHVISMQYPIPTDQIKRDHSTGKRVVLSEVERREKYLAKMISGSLLKQITVSCLQDEPEYRPTIERVTKELHRIKNSALEQSRYSKFNIVDLLICLSDKEKYMVTLRTELRSFDSYKKTTQTQIKELETRLQTVTEELNAQKDLNKRQQKTIDVLRKSTIAEPKYEKSTVLSNNTTSTGNKLLPPIASSSVDVQPKSARDLFMTIPSNQRMEPLVPYKHTSCIPPTMEISGPPPSLDYKDYLDGGEVTSTSEGATNASVRRRRR
ncbi:probable serine/threonine-protein kinase kinX [Dysidea avara]|uniref:probable serine/threonine-protein kinase kinX n=1 Tax=Dysidea avara TaxID=196820 RepID=UPI0033346B68